MQSMKQMLKFVSCVMLMGMLTSCAGKRAEKIMVATSKGDSLTEGRMTEQELRTELTSFSDTASTRVNQLCDEIARKSNTLETRSRANLEKISFTRICVENASQPQVVAGLSDMTFQVTMKARAAKRRLDALRAAATRPSTQASSQPARDSFDLYAEQFDTVYKINNDEIWQLAKRALPEDTYNTLAISLEKWLDQHADLRYATARTSELRPYISGDSENAFAFIDLKSTTDQIDRGIWIAQRMPDQLRWQTEQVIYDAFRQVASEREATLRQVADEITNQRKASLEEVNRELSKYIDTIIAKIDQQRMKAFDEGFAKLAGERERTINQATMNADQLIARSIDHFFNRLRNVLIGVGLAVFGLVILLVVSRRSRRLPE